MIRTGSVVEARRWGAERRRAGQRVALVPTMGALHAGHLAHVAWARRDGAAVAMSVFVNPTQFGPGEDFARYPRDLDADAGLAAEAGVDLLFAPEPREIYPDGEPSVTVDVGRLATVLEGRWRPTHFRGVATVVAKLLTGLQPDVVTFGQKDAQQVVVARRLVRDLLLPVEVLCVPTVREADGLALSSRNRYLTAPQRRAAPVLGRALAAAAALVESGERDAQAVLACAEAVLATEPLGRTDYLEAASAEDLRPLTVLQGRVLLLLAVRFGQTRLLDNACLDVGVAAAARALP